MNRTRLLKCRIRQCCLSKGFRTCAQCSVDVSQCKIYNNLISKLFGRLFNSDRAACISYIRRYGDKAFADRMTLHEQMTMKRNG